MKRLWLLLALASCSSSSDDDYPIGGGNPPPINGSGSGGTKDGGVDDGGVTDGGVLVTGRVCLLDDMRKIGDRTACAKTGVDALTVSIGMGLRTSTGTRTAKPAADGAFSLVAPVGDGYQWHVTGPTTGTNRVIASTMLYGTENLIPVLREDAYRDLASSNGAQLGLTDASLVVRVVRGTKGVTSLAASTVGLSTAPLYDTTNANNWDPDVATGSFGIAWLPDYAMGGAPSATTKISLTVQGMGTVVVKDRSFPLEAGTVTFATIELPPVP